MSAKCQRAGASYHSLTALGLWVHIHHANCLFAAELRRRAHAMACQPDCAAIESTLTYSHTVLPQCESIRQACIYVGTRYIFVCTEPTSHRALLRKARRRPGEGPSWKAAHPRLIGQLRVHGSIKGASPERSRLRSNHGVSAALHLPPTLEELRMRTAQCPPTMFTRSTLATIVCCLALSAGNLETENIHKTSNACSCCCFAVVAVPMHCR
jgi:hypothetical protein